MCQVALERSAHIGSVACAEEETLVEFLDSLVLAGALAGTGFGARAVWVRGTRLGVSVSGSA